MDPQGHCALGLAVPDDQIELSIYDALCASVEKPMDLSKVIWQIGNKKKNSSWIPASEFAEILDRKGFNPDGMPLLTEV